MMLVGKFGLVVPLMEGYGGPERGGRSVRVTLEPGALNDPSPMISVPRHRRVPSRWINYPRTNMLHSRWFYREYL